VTLQCIGTFQRTHVRKESDRHEVLMSGLITQKEKDRKYTRIERKERKREISELNEKKPRKTMMKETKRDNPTRKDKCCHIVESGFSEPIYF
jgi:hypothetical protein